jgi:hypothetical protein
MEQRAAIEFCVKLKKTTTETFECFKNTYGEACLSRTSMFEWHKKYIEVQKVRKKKSRVKTMLTIFYAKVIIHHEFVPENRL